MATVVRPRTPRRDLDAVSSVLPLTQKEGDWQRTARRKIPKARWRQLEQYAAEFFQTLGMQLDSPGTRDTPRRFVRALFDATEEYDGAPKLVYAVPCECEDGAACRRGQ